MFLNVTQSLASKKNVHAFNKMCAHAQPSGQNSHLTRYFTSRIVLKAGDCALKMPKIQGDQQKVYVPQRLNLNELHLLRSQPECILYLTRLLRLKKQ